MAIADRLDLTLRLVRGAGKVTLTELASRLGVSEMTVRRDLDRLQERGLVSRVRGGAVALRPRPEAAGFAAREGWQVATKARLGAATAELVQPGQTILLDAGTTMAQVAGHLVTRAPLTVVVLGLQAATHLADQPDVRLLVLGGESRPGERSLVGYLALRALESLSFDCFLMSIGAVHHTGGWSEFDPDDAAVKRAALGRSERTIVVADSTKLGARAFAKVAELAAVDTFVTDDAALDPVVDRTATETLTAIADAGVEVLRA
ncbi:DeoR/GlpR transcriptional regulator [Planomonospora sp. ID67723]|uniref:DeoR/GlpR family DNA-binding transcription regulator n=1 Tax=Planomonospora sp. ID67723 TaxID=2738134 RepID=UPI0018C3D8A2|nr:DeoR/GlpR family DNA-binding transcription regulator [Planomonospora sp. ID67723]MBG0829735.1 DeoR/GlpR transcriptional regulator [Planomonospora sp. ID67723]